MKRIALVLLLVISAQTPSIAGGRSIWSGAKSVGTGNWSVIAVGLDQAPASTPYTITWSVNTGIAYNFFTLRNTGTFSIGGLSVDVSQAQLGGSGKPNNTTFELCQNGVWNATTNTCSGTRVTVGTATDANSSIIFNGLTLSDGAELSMRVSTPPNIKNSYTTTLSVNVSRNQIRPGVVVNS